MNDNNNQALPITLQGKVTHFKGNGRKLGYPTANIHTNTTLDDGVYFGWADLGEYKHYPALIFIGTPTTVGDKGRRVEAHLLDAKDVDYYDLELKLGVQLFHRSNQTFKSIDELLIAMKSDEASGRAWAKS